MRRRTGVTRYAPNIRSKPHASTVNLDVRRCRQQVPPKHSYLSTRPYGVTPDDRNLHINRRDKIKACILLDMPSPSSQCVTIHFDIIIPPMLGLLIFRLEF